MSIKIDGSILEGGGQILRNTISFCCLTHQNVQIDNIRGKRSKPGLRPQHLQGLQLVGRICNGKIQGDKVDSTSICFEPDGIKSGEYEADTKTAGSITLLMQIAVPCLCFADGVSTLRLKGGTDVEMAPTIDHFTNIFVPTAAKFGLNIKCDLIRRGFYPKGKGEVNVVVNSVSTLQPVSITDFGELKSIIVQCFVAGNLPLKVADRMKTTAAKYISEQFPVVDVLTSSNREDENKAFGTGCGILIQTKTTTGCILGVSAVGKKGKPAEQIAEETAQMFCNDLLNEICVDNYLQDQLIVLMALANGTSTIKTGPISLHSKTAIYIAESIIGASFKIEKLKSENVNMISCKGIGLNLSTSKD